MLPFLVKLLFLPRSLYIFNISHFHLLIIQFLIMTSLNLLLSTSPKTVMFTNPMYFSIFILLYFATVFNMVSHPLLLSSFSLCLLSSFPFLSLVALFQILLLAYLLFNLKTHLDLILSLFLILSLLSVCNLFHGFKTQTFT